MNPPNLYAEAGDVVRRLIQDGVEHGMTVQALRLWFINTLDVEFYLSSAGGWAIHYQGWYWRDIFLTFHEMLPTLLGFVGKTPDELTALFTAKPGTSQIKENGV